MSETKRPSRLWEIDHPYYCSESNYYASGANQPYCKYDSWAEFIGSEGDSDLDMNLVFRWDWKASTYEDMTPEYHAQYDDNYRAYTLWIFWMGQRKGLFRVTEVSVCRADEPAVRDWLTIRWEHLRLLWEPFGKGSSS